MPHGNEEVIRRAYDAINRGDLTAFAAEFTADAVWHGAEAHITGAHAINVLANEDHGVALQITHAERPGRSLADRVVSSPAPSRRGRRIAAPLALE